MRLVAVQRLAFSRSPARANAIDRERLVAASDSQNRSDRAVGLERGVGPHRKEWLRAALMVMVVFPLPLTPLTVHSYVHCDDALALLRCCDYLLYRIDDDLRLILRNQMIALLGNDQASS